MGIINRNLKLSQFQKNTRWKMYIIILHYELYYMDVKRGQLENRINTG